MKARMLDELKDIGEMIHRFIAVNKHGVAFVGSFIAFDKGGEIKDEANSLFAYGDIESLRVMLNELRDVVEDDADEDGLVNL